MKYNNKKRGSMFQWFQFFIFVFIIASLLYIIYKVTIVRKYNNKTNEKIIIEQKNINTENPYGLFTRPNYAYSNLPNDVLLNPYVPPLKDERYILDDRLTFEGGYRVPINVRSNLNSIDTNYRQVGILTSANGNGKQKILALMGRPLYTNRNKWNYYTQDEKNSIKLPIVYKQKSCTNEYGCDEIYNNDKVLVKGYNNMFKVEMYDNDTIRYLPFF